MSIQTVECYYKTISKIVWRVSRNDSGGSRLEMESQIIMPEADNGENVVHTTEDSILVNTVLRCRWRESK